MGKLKREFVCLNKIYVVMCDWVDVWMERVR